MNQDFAEMLGALCDQQVEFIVVGAYAMGAPRILAMPKHSGTGEVLPDLVIG